MKKITTLFFGLIFISNATSQFIYISSTNNDIFRLNIETCTYDLVIKVQNIITDISFHPNGNLYGISGNGNFFEIDTISGTTNILHKFEGQSFNSLTINDTGLVFTTDAEGNFWTYDIETKIPIFKGDIGFRPTGDLTFYQGELFVSVRNNRIVHIDIETPSDSYVSINGNIDREVWGIVSFAEECSSVSVFALTEGTSIIYEIDFENGVFDYVCQLDVEIGGGASTFEFLASNPLAIDHITVDDPKCDSNDGTIEIEAKGGFGQLQYSIDGINFQESPIFDNLIAGNYIIVVQDGNSCMISDALQITSVNAPVFTDIIVRNTTCGIDNGSVDVFAIGGNGDLSYSIDGINFQKSPVFENLAIGSYMITVKDVDDCTVYAGIQILWELNPSISNLGINHARCGENNGSINVLAQGLVDGFQYSINGANFQSSTEFVDLSPGVYTLTLIDENDCEVNESFEILATNIPSVPNYHVLNTSCGLQNGRIQMVFEGLNVEYSLNGAEYQKSGRFENLSDGVYTINAIDSNACMHTFEFDVLPSRAMEVNILSQVAAECGASNGKLSIDVLGGVGEIEISKDGQVFDSDFTIDGLAAGEHNFLFIDEDECTLETKLIVPQEDCPIYIPNVFSPNNDGNNDLFVIQPHIDFVGEFLAFKVYDRWGTNVFEARDFEPEEVAWNGTFNGQKLLSGVYVYLVEYINQSGSREILRGDVTIVD